MARRPDTLEKSWIIGPARGTQTFNAPSNLFIDYGRHIATVSGRGGSGNAPDAVYTSNYSTNYNIAYPTANQPIANRPETAWTTNYNVVYPIANQPIANQPATAFTTNYSTNYNTAYPIANQPETARPITSYTPGNPGASTTVLGVLFPGGPVSTVAPNVSPTLVDYERFPDDANYPVTVPPGGQIVIKIE